eukprot:1730251-Rhodomonas_salina.2
MAARMRGSKPKTKFAAKNEIWCLPLTVTAHSGRERHLSGCVAWGECVCQGQFSTFPTINGGAVWRETDA